MTSGNGGSSMTMGNGGMTISTNGNGIFSASDLQGFLARKSNPMRARGRQPAVKVGDQGSVPLLLTPINARAAFGTATLTISWLRFDFCLFRLLLVGC